MKQHMITAIIAIILCLSSGPKGREGGQKGEWVEGEEGGKDRGREGESERDGERARGERERERLVTYLGT